MNLRLGKLSSGRSRKVSLRAICLLNFSLPRISASMKRYLATFFLPIGVLLIATAQPTFANLIVNGDFQTRNLSGWATTTAAPGTILGVSGIPPANHSLGGTR